MTRLNLKELLGKIPKKYQQPNNFLSSLAVVQTISLIVGSLFVVNFLYNFDWLGEEFANLNSAISLVLLVLFGWWFYGTVITGGFVIAHDAAHKSLFKNQKLNSFFGSLLGGWVGWPFWLWKEAHDIHHRFTNHIEKDIAWEPLTKEQFDQTPRFIRFFYQKIRGDAKFIWIGGLFHLLDQYRLFLMRKRFKKQNRARIWRSIVVCNLVWLFSLLVYYQIAGGFGLVFGLVANARFTWWMTIFTYLHHTTPERKFLSAKEWEKDPIKAQLDGTLHVRHSLYTDILTHWISWHIPHHLSTSIPSYHLVKASKILKEHYPNSYLEVPYSREYLKRVIAHCQCTKSASDLGWRRFY